MSNEQDKSREDRIGKPIGWKTLGLRVLGVYILYSIASHIFDPSPTEYYWTPAQKIVVPAFGYLIMFLGNFIFVSLIACLITRVVAKNKTKPLPPVLNGALIATIFLSAFLIHGGWYGHKMDAELSDMNLNYNGGITSTESEKVFAAITSQGTDGVTTSDLDQNALKNIEAWIVQTTLRKAKNYYSDLGNDSANLQPKVVANSVYLNVDHKKLAIIKINIDNLVRSVTILGIEGEELLRVGCIRKGNQDIPLFSGECSAKIQEAFGVSIKL